MAAQCKREMHWHGRGGSWQGWSLPEMEMEMDPMEIEMHQHGYGRRWAGHTELVISKGLRPLTHCWRYTAARRCPGRGRGDASDAHRGDDSRSRLLLWSTLHVNTTPRPRAPASPSPSSAPDPAAAAPPMPASRCVACGLWPSAAGRLRFPIRRMAHVALTAPTWRGKGIGVPLLLCFASCLGVSPAPARPAGVVLPARVHGQSLACGPRSSLSTAPL